MSFFRRDKKYILLPVVEDKATMKMAFLFSQFFLEEDKLLGVKYFFPLTGEDILTIKNRIYRRTKGFRYYGSFYEKKVMQMHGVRPKDIAFSNFSLFFWKNKKRSLSSKEELLAFRIGNIAAGDLIYDTYLRYKKKPTVDMDDPALQDVINYACQLARRIDKYLASANIAAVIIPYTTYIHWGLLTRMALSRNIPVYTFGNINYLLQRATASFPFHSKNYPLFHKLFTSIENNESLMPQVAEAIAKRMNGVVDASSWYMRKSAFAKQDNAPGFTHISDKPFAIIFAHCFFDSPHIYGSSLFPDFYEWIRFLLTVASTEPDVVYYVKPHPNGIQGNTEILAELFREFHFPNIILLDSNISNMELINSKPDAVFSVYGTVCHEFAYVGVPAILAGENPHGEYGFYYNPKTKESMETFVRNVGKYGLPEAYVKRDIEEFFFMNYMYVARNIYNMDLQKIKDFETGDCILPLNAALSDIIYPSLEE